MARQVDPASNPGAASQGELEARKAEARAWFESLQASIFQAFHALEDSAPDGLYPGGPGRLEATPWTRSPGPNGEDQGGGVMGMLRGRFFEKAGVHTSTVFGTFSPDFARQVRGAAEDPRFWASGISLIAHPRNPRVPAVHMNTRMIVTTDWWFGGGADLNPIVTAHRDRTSPDAADFHAALKTACDPFDPEYYPKYARWAEDYFFLPHRGEHRGVGGIFYDHHNTGDWAADFRFTKAVGQAFLDIYPALAARRSREAWTSQDHEDQLKWRSRYVEFNLLYDRGTTFGLKTGGNVESILSSMPPLAAWP